MSETWRPVRLGFLQQESAYDISDFGNVRNRERGKLLRPYVITNRNGDHYAKVNLWMGGLRFPCFVHRLVAQAFIPNPDSKFEVDHGDQNTLNNAAANLTWVTRRENESLKRFSRELDAIEEVTA